MHMTNPTEQKIVSCAWLLEHVGKPSGHFGSKYTAIYQAMEKAEKDASVANLRKVFTLSLEWSKSKHESAKTPEQRQMKESQQLNLNRFMSYLQVEVKTKSQEFSVPFSRELLYGLKQDDANYAKEKEIIWSVFDEMAVSPKPLVANTGRYLKERIVRFEDIGIASKQDNGSISGAGVLSINPVFAYHTSELKGILVHEVHHRLCHWTLAGALYLDEFAAHMKQYSITRPPMSDAEMTKTVNKVLAANYKSAVDAWKREGNRLVERLDDLGDFLVPDNAQVTDCLEHYCVPTRSRSATLS
jgi:hypothetical protein